PIQLDVLPSWWLSVHTLCLVEWLLPCYLRVSGLVLCSLGLTFCEVSLLFSNSLRCWPLFVSCNNRGQLGTAGIMPGEQLSTPDCPFGVPRSKLLYVDGFLIGLDIL